MRAVVITEPGGPEVMRWLEVPDPAPGPGEVVIEVAASGVNRADLMQREGHYPPPPGAPPYPGLECSGRVSGVGEDVTAWRPGDEVCALLSGGGYAEQVAVPAGQLLPVPEKVDAHYGAAAFPEAACTVYSNVFQLAGLSERRDAARARRQQRDRHDGDPAGQGVRGHGRRAPPDRRRSWPAAASSARTIAINYRERGLRRGHAGCHRRGAAPT